MINRDDPIDTRTVCWVLTDGKAGMQSQCLGLAAALNLDPVIKQITPRFPWSILPPQAWIAPLSATDTTSDALVPPWPDVLIATGRQTVAPALAIKKASGGKTIAVQIQNPRVAPGRFDLVITPAHDQLAGTNVVQTMGALHGVTDQKLRGSASRFAPMFEDLPRPILSVLIGGSNSQYQMTAALTEKLGALLRQSAEEHGVGLAITTSRRTGSDNVRILTKALADLPAIIWDGEGDNPYFGMLGCADAILVTGDSVNMVSEAAATGKPVYIFDLEGGSKKFSRFHQSMAEHGVTRKFDGTIESWSYQPPTDMTMARDAVLNLLKDRKQQAI